MKKETSAKKGKRAEEIAQEHIKKLGYKVLDVNWHVGHLELDIVALDGDQLVIVEVKSRYDIPWEHPSEAVNHVKIRRIVEAADAYVMLKNMKHEVRFDVITIMFYGFEFELEHFVDAFYPTS